MSDIPKEQSPNKAVVISFPDGRLVEKVVDVLVRNRPIGWSRRARSPYYKKCYAMWLKESIDPMIEDRQPRVFRRETFTGLSEKSLYLRIHQSLLYLIECLDTPDKKYERFKEETRFRIKQGVIIEYRDMADVSGIAEVFVAEKEMPKWRRKLDEWIESDSREPFIQTNLVLSGEEQQQLRLELDNLKNIMSSISAREIKLVRIV